MNHHIFQQHKEYQDLQEVERDPELYIDETFHIRRHNNLTRKLFIAAGVLMLIGLPFFAQLIPTPIWLTIVIIMLFSIFGSIIDPRSRWVSFAFLAIAAIAFVIFEFHAARTYTTNDVVSNLQVVFFWVNQLLAVIFFFAIQANVRFIQQNFFRGDTKLKS